ncbi:MAG: hypothetical protein HUJ53_04595 [Holdemanella sp.]|nr:hypothetical protein [Holdemanella sp.]
MEVEAKKKLINIIKALGQEIMDNAENMVSDYPYMMDNQISINIYIKEREPPVIK